MKRYLAPAILALLVLASVLVSTTAGACGTGIWPCTTGTGTTSTGK